MRLSDKLQEPLIKRSTPWSALAWQRFGPTDLTGIVVECFSFKAALRLQRPKRRRAAALQGVDAFTRPNLTSVCRLASAAN